MPHEIDAIDKAILRIVQREGRIQNNELAERVGLSPSPCLRRVRLLEDNGIIARYAAVLNPAEIGMGLTFFARVWLNGQDVDTVDIFVTAIQKLPNIIECHLMAGDSDFLLKIVAKDLDDYRRFQVEHLGRIKGVRNIKTDIPLQVIKQSSEFPI